jgi:hypothetical protein
MVWQLLQVGLLEERPLIFVGDRWSGLRRWVERDVVAAGLASPRDLELVHWTTSDEEALAVIRQARDRFLARHEVVLPPPAEEP